MGQGPSTTHDEVAIQDPTVLPLVLVLLNPLLPPSERVVLPLPALPFSATPELALPCS